MRSSSAILPCEPRRATVAVTRPLVRAINFASAAPSAAGATTKTVIVFAAVARQDEGSTGSPNPGSGWDGFFFPCREGLSFRDPNLSHHFVDALSPGEKDRVVARRIGAVAADGEGGIDGKPFLRRDARLVEPAEPRQGGREVEMRGLEIPVDLDCVAQLRSRFLVFAEKHLRD